MLIEIITTALVAAFFALLVFPEHFARDRPDAADSPDATAALVQRLKERFDAEAVAW